MREQKKLLRPDIIEELSIISGFTKKDSERFLDAFHYMILRAIKEDTRIQDIGYFDMYVSRIPSGTAFQPDKNGGGKYITRQPCNRFVIKIGDVIKKQTNPNKYKDEETTEVSADES